MDFFSKPHDMLCAPVKTVSVHLTESCDYLPRDRIRCVCASEFKILVSLSV